MPSTAAPLRSLRRRSRCQRRQLPPVETGTAGSEVYPPGRHGPQGGPSQSGEAVRSSVSNSTPSARREPPPPGRGTSRPTRLSRTRTRLSPQSQRIHHPRSAGASPCAPSALTKALHHQRLQLTHTRPMTSSEATGPDQGQTFKVTPTRTPPTPRRRGATWKVAPPTSGRQPTANITTTTNNKHQTTAASSRTAKHAPASATLSNGTNTNTSTNTNTNH